MNIKIRKQYSKGFQVYEIELDNVPQDKIESANAWLDNIGVAEINKMADAVNPSGQPTPTQAPKASYSKPAYSKPQNTPTYGGATKSASPKQIEWLDKKGIKYDPATITSAEASRLLDEVFLHDKRDSQTVAPALTDPYADMGQEIKAVSDGLPF